MGEELEKEKIRFNQRFGLEPLEAVEASLEYRMMHDTELNYIVNWLGTLTTVQRNKVREALAKVYTDDEVKYGS